MFRFFLLVVIVGVGAVALWICLISLFSICKAASDSRDKGKKNGR